MRQRLSGVSIESISKSEVFRLEAETNIPIFMIELNFEQELPEARRERQSPCPMTTGIYEIRDEEVPNLGGLARLVATPFVRPAFRHVSAAIFSFS